MKHAIFFIRWTQRKLVGLSQLGDIPCLSDPPVVLAGLSGMPRRTIGQGEFYGVDNSSKMIEEAQAKFQSCGNLHFY